jgi:hypothetical protein
MQIKTRAAGVGAALCAVGVATSIAAPSASASRYAPPPYYSIGSASACEYMWHSNTKGMATYRYKLRPPSGPSSYPELRIRIGYPASGSAPSVCAYVADYLPGKHRMTLVLARDGWQTRATDSNYYEDYAGALYAKGPGPSREWFFSVYAKVNYSGRDYTRRVVGRFLTGGQYWPDQKEDGVRFN